MVQGIRGTSTAQHASSTPSSVLNSAMHGVASEHIMSPLEAWKRIVEDPETRESYVKVRGMGDLVRTSWDEATEIIAAANLYTIEKYGPDRIAGFSPIPGYSMVSYGAGIRYLSLIGGAALSFYDCTATFPLRPLKLLESKRTCPSLRHGITPTTFSAGARTSR